MTEGIDVSKYQTTTPSLAGLEFLFAKATEGTQPDPRYAQHIAAARKAGLVTGAYHFNYSPLAIGAQVKAFLAVAGDVDLYAIDVEGQNAFSKAQTAQFIAGVQAAGKKCGLYHSASGFFDAGQDWNWIAKWSPTPPAGRWAFWQYRGSPLDLDRFNGTLAQLRAFVGTKPEDDTVGLFTDPLPLPQAKGKIKPGGHTIFRVADSHAFPIADGTDIGVVTHANLIGTLPSWANGDPHVVLFKFGKYGTAAAVIRDVALVSLPALDPKVAVNAALDKAIAAINGVRP